MRYLLFFSLFFVCAMPGSLSAEQLSNQHTGFRFGSYGRTQLGFDRDGNAGRNTNVVAHGSRLFEGSYLELEFSQPFALEDGFTSDVVITLALFDPLAHYSGVYGGEGWAIRNAYVESGSFIPALPDLKVWAGSRMYRGDDIYLLDTWPLDNLNTVGGGLIYEKGPWDLRVHAGVNRLADEYQFQTVRVADSIFGSRELVLLDRQRLIVSGRAGWKFLNLNEDGLGAKVLFYGEGHRLPAGRRVLPQVHQGGNSRYPLDESMEDIPADDGYVVGAQVGVFGFGPDSHLNLFARHAEGIAAYGETGVPWGMDALKTAQGARDILLAISGNWQNDSMGLLLGGYWRRFNDADREDYDLNDFAEGSLIARPILYITDHFHQGFELGYQAHYPFGLEPDGETHNVGRVWQFSVMEIISLGKGSYVRPNLRLYYTCSLSNEAARARFADEDRRRPDSIEHFIGLGAEWWFNSNTY